MKIGYWKIEKLEAKMANLLQGNKNRNLSICFFYQTEIICISTEQKSKGEHAISQSMGPNQQ